MVQGLFTGKPKYHGNWFADHSLSLVLLGLLILQSVGFHLLEWPQYVTDTQAHNGTVSIKDYWTLYWAKWLVSVLADTYGALLLVWLTKFFYERGSAESNGPEE